MQVFSFSMDKGFLVKTWSRERVIDIPDGKYLVQFKGDAPFIEVGGELVFLNFQATAVPTKLYGFSIEKLEAVTPVFTTVEMAIESGKAMYDQYRKMLAAVKDPVYFVVSTEK